MIDRTVAIVLAADAEMRSYVRLALGDDRFEIRAAEDTAAAIHLVADQLPTMMVLDLDVAGGEALARSLRDQPETRSVRTLALVSRGRPLRHDATGIDGIDGSLLVPATTFALLREVDRLLPD